MPDSSDFRPGGRVNVTIENALIVSDGYDERYGSEYLRIALPINGDEAHGRIHLEAEGVTVEHATPENWPPRVNDLWKHRLGAVLFGMESGSNVVLTYSGGALLGPEQAWEMRHDLTLVYREGGGPS